MKKLQLSKWMMLAIGSMALSSQASPTAHAQQLQAKQNSVRIIGGEKSVEGRFPFITALVSSADTEIRPFCGASFIGGRYVLTASHCVDGSAAESLDVWIGGLDISKPEGGKRVSVSQIYMHEDYDSDTINKDLAILELAEPIQGVTPIKIVDMATDDAFKEGDMFTVAGWGNRDAQSAEGDFPSVLHQVSVPLYNRQACLDAYKQPNAEESDITEFMMCAGLVEGGKDSCQGDSGGPFMFRQGDEWVQAGVVSFGNGCAEANNPGIYTRLGRLTDWIEKRSQGVSYRQNLDQGFVENNFDEIVNFEIKNLNTDAFQVQNVSISDMTGFDSAIITENACDGKNIATNESCTVSVKVVTAKEGKASFRVKATTSNTKQTPIDILFAANAAEPTSLDLVSLVDAHESINWFSSSSASWEAQTDKVVTGTNAIASAKISDFESSVLIGVIDNKHAKSVDFKYLVSSEEGYDFFNVYLNNKLVVEASGTADTDFTASSVELASGKNRLVFLYTKDSSDFNNEGDPAEVGDDKVYIDDIKLTIANTAPTVVLKEETMTVEEGKEFTLDASGSTDPENDNLTYKWEVVGDTQVTISSPEQSVTKVTAPAYATVKSVSFKVTVTDELNETSEKQVKVDITQKPTPPAPAPTTPPAATNQQSSSGGSTTWVMLLTLLGFTLVRRK